MPDLAALISAQLQLARDGRVGYLEGQISPAESGGWTCTLEAAAFEPINISAQLSGPSAEVEDIGYLTFCSRMAPGSRLLMATGDWHRPHPWLSVFVPCNAVRQFVADALTGLSADLLGPIPMLLYPLRRGDRPAPGLTTPAADADGLFYLFSILRTVPGTPDAITAALASNTMLSRRAVEMGGGVYQGASVIASTAPTSDPL
jgi:cytokinin dehydrogenase